MEKTIGQQDEPSWQAHLVTLAEHNESAVAEMVKRSTLGALADQARAQREALVAALHAVPLAPDALSRTGVPWSRYRDEVIAQFAPERLTEVDVIEYARQIADSEPPPAAVKPPPVEAILEAHRAVKAQREHVRRSAGAVRAWETRRANLRRAAALRAWKTRRANAKKKGGR